ncbi:TRAFAC clade GTPase domain-containing protein [Microbispora hainanensis]|uniref:Double-GTPase 1 domain-containing protein n=1 Tax=Microbispora hainanensis TaxID=568844 RepID=A0ABZ1SHC2_9ACTN|nr:hypothetical protein [Microbispora hainanensis]
MNIVMLGHNAAGKTTYVSLMYARMYEGIEGFGLRASAVDDHRVFIAAAEGIRWGRYPQPSDHRAVFDLVLQHGGRDVYPFTWRDYRGGALNEHVRDSPQAAELHEDLKAADAILVFADAHRLATDARGDREARRIISHVQRALDAPRTGNAVVLVLLTKCDLVDFGRASVGERVTAPFGELLNATDSDEKVVGGLIPVACGPRPRNIELPVLLCLYYGLTNRVTALQSMIDNHMRDARDRAEHDTLLNRWISRAVGEQSHADRVNALWHAAKQEYDRLTPLLDPARQLKRYLDRAMGAVS